MTVTCTIESRIGSTRLPGKALYPFYETTVLGSVIANALAAREVERVIVCTSTAPHDAVIEDYARRAGAEVFRGDEDDVAGRIAAALQGAEGCNVFLTGDNPLVTPDLIDSAVEQFAEAPTDYLCSTHMKYCQWWTEPPVLPKGLSVQVAGTAFFIDSVARNTIESFRQHSTMVMYGNRLAGRRYRALRPPSVRVPDMSRSYTIDTAMEYLDLSRRWASRPRTLEETLQAG